MHVLMVAVNTYLNFKGIFNFSLLLEISDVKLSAAYVFLAPYSKFPVAFMPKGIDGHKLV